MGKLRDWTKEVAEARSSGYFPDDAKVESQDFRYCLIASKNAAAGKELHTRDKIISNLGYAFCSAVCRDQVDLAHYIKLALDEYYSQYYGVK